MANLGQVYNRNEMPENAFAPIPDGEYVAMIISSDRVESKSTPGNYYIKLVVEIVDGQYKGRQIYENLNLWNSNPDTVKIAESTLGAIMDATGKQSAADTAEFHNIPVRIKTKIKPGTGGYNDSNAIKSWSAAGSKQAPQPEMTSKKPWENSDEWK